MSKIEKLLVKLKSRPKDLTWQELKTILAHYGFVEMKKKGKTGGSRVKFIDNKNRIINLHKPHPEPTVKQYIIKQLIEKLKLWKII